MRKPLTDDQKIRRREYCRRWQRENRGRQTFLSARHKLVRMYGLTREQAEVALVSQRGDVCFSCGKVDRLVVDHDHRTTAARGMVCYQCNQIAGALEHEKVQVVKEYLERSVA